MSVTIEKAKTIGVTVPMSGDEFDWLIHAAKLEGVTPREYVVRAINQRLCSQGVDAVLLKERP